MTYRETIKQLPLTISLSIKDHFYKNGLSKNLFTKIQRIYDKAINDNLKVISALEEHYVQGRINKNRYMQLMNRKSDITIDLIIFGKLLYVTFAIKYITGELNRDEYFKIVNDIFPEDIIHEKKRITLDIIKIINDLEDFERSIKITEKDTCQLCEAKESLFNKLKIFENYRLCGKCRKYLIDTEKYEGFTGSYFIVNPFMISLQEIKNNIDIEVFINNEALL
jgi:hypothetical protein